MRRDARKKDCGAAFTNSLPRQRKWSRRAAYHPRLSQSLNQVRKKRNVFPIFAALTGPGAVRTLLQIIRRLQHDRPSWGVEERWSDALIRSTFFRRGRACPAPNSWSVKQPVCRPSLMSEYTPSPTPSWRPEWESEAGWLYQVACDLCMKCGHIQTRCKTDPEAQYSGHDYSYSSREVESDHEAREMLAYSIIRYLSFRLTLAVGGRPERRLLADLIARRSLAWQN